MTSVNSKQNQLNNEKLLERFKRFSISHVVDQQSYHGVSIIGQSNGSEFFLA